MNFRNELAELVYVRTYSRWNDDLKRREAWDESVDRYKQFFIDKVPDSLKNDFNESIESFREYEISPAMRAFWTAGEALKRENICGFNCSGTVIDHPKKFAEILYILLCGAGAGFSVERQFINDLPIIQTLEKSSNVIIFEDSKLGWAEGFYEFLKCLYAGEIPLYDTSKIRKKGSILKVFGGRASGKKPLEELLKFTTDVFKNAEGRKLTSLECHDIVCYIASIVECGGVRRSSTISLSNLSDIRMAEAKHGSFWEANPHRMMANNSVAYSEKPDQERFMSEWLNLMKSKSGERGIFNREGVKKTAISQGRPDANYVVNPCQPKDATVLTPDGIRRFEDIDVGSTVWSGSQWTNVIKKANNGIKPVYKYKTTSGYFLGTEDHRIVQRGKKIAVKKATAIDWNLGPVDTYSELDPQIIMDGLVLGDGSVHKASNNLVILYIGEKDYDYQTSEIAGFLEKYRPGVSKNAWEISTNIHWSELPKTYDRVVPNRYLYGDTKTKRSFLRGLFSANGTVSGKRVCLKQSSEKLIEQVQEMLSSLGIHSYVTTNKSKSIEFSNGEYVSKKSYDINISHCREEFINQIGFIQKYKNEKIKIVESSSNKSTYEIRDTFYIGEEEVFDITVDCDSHTYWSGGCLVSNCGEIILQPNSFCNLSEVILRPNDTIEEIDKKVYNTTLFAMTQSTLTDFNFLDESWKENCLNDRVIGVSLTGLREHNILKKKSKEAEDMLIFLRKKAHEYSEKFAKELNISKPKAVTTVKPSGSVSLLMGTTSGLHTAYFKYGIRRVRITSTDPLCKMLIDQGASWSPEVGQDEFTCNTKVFEFPYKYSEEAICKNETDIIEQLEYWKMLKTCWCDHNPSCSIYVKDDEWLKAGSWVWDNWDLIGGLSFLPDTNSYRLAPLEEITFEEYKKMKENFPKIDYSKLSEYEIEDMTQGSHEVACSGGACAF